MPVSVSALPVITRRDAESVIATGPTALDDDLSRSLRSLGDTIDGDLQIDDLSRRVYATDASAYQAFPIGVVYPRHHDDVVKIVRFAIEHRIGLIPRAAGTSLAGQCVGDGLVVDCKLINGIIRVDVDGDVDDASPSATVTVGPAVIRNELNDHLRPMGWMFGPETSTQNRAMIGGMVGNNSCGSNSIRYGSTREHLVRVVAVLGDGSTATFESISPNDFQSKCDGDSMEADLYRHVRDTLGDPARRREITRRYPKPSIRRRNTGYALDLLMDADAIDPESSNPFNFCRLIAGSEGTLAMVTEITVSLVPTPPPVSALQCAHFDDIDSALRATIIATENDVDACELIDDVILKCTERSLEHRDNRFFIQGAPKAILVTEIRGDDRDAVEALHRSTEAKLRREGLGYAYPIVWGDDARRVFDLRKAGLGLLGNIPGDDKTVPVVEDTAVDVADLPAYIAEFNDIMDRRYGLSCVHYAHAGSGELHLRPIINLKTDRGKMLFREVAGSVATLVRKYRGSLSGEHGDGRLRGEFLAEMIGEENYALCRSFKRNWDPHGIFNPGKIVDTPPMNTSLRYDASDPDADPVATHFDWSASHGILRAAEMCNGSGDCRKTHHTGGVMCPSYMATRNERDTTRARANVMRQVLTSPQGDNPFDDDDLKDVLDLCLSCKGCKSECPSTVDMGRMKAEFLQHYHDAHGVPRRDRFFASFGMSSRIASSLPRLVNAAVSTPPVRGLINRIVGLDRRRSLPSLAKIPFDRWYRRNRERLTVQRPVAQVQLLVDEFCRYHDVSVATAAMQLMSMMDVDVTLTPIRESGRGPISRGLLRDARRIARRNVLALRDRVDESSPLVGLEPSAVLTFRDEVPDLVGDDLRDDALKIAEHAMTFEEWMASRIDGGWVPDDWFIDANANLMVHGHCFQKALSDVSKTATVVSVPRGYTATVVPSGCCGMAGGFGYESEHYDLSMQIGELVLLPAVRSAPDDTIIVATGTSCRHQIFDGTGRTASHPAEVLWRASIACDRSNR